jgi:hypothetical protein
MVVGSHELRAFYDELTAGGAPSVGQPLLVESGPNEGRLAVYMLEPDGFPIELLEVLG